MHLLRGQSSATQCLEVVGEQLISVSNGGCVVVHDSFENSVSEVVIKFSPMPGVIPHYNPRVHFRVHVLVMCNV